VPPAVVPAFDWLIAALRQPQLTGSADQIS